MEKDLETLRCSRIKQENVKIMAQASVCLRCDPAADVMVRRGMTLISSEGREAGKAAGVAVSSENQQSLCLIMGHLPEEEGYQSIPVSWIKRVEGEEIFLNARFDVIQALPDWHSA